MSTRQNFALHPAAPGTALLGQTEYDSDLSCTSLIILAAVLLIIVLGLGWCFYKALSANDKRENQHPDEIGDE